MRKSFNEGLNTIAREEGIKRRSSLRKIGIIVATVLCCFVPQQGGRMILFWLINGDLFTFFRNFESQKLRHPFEDNQSDPHGHIRRCRIVKVTFEYEARGEQSQ